MEACTPCDDSLIRQVSHENLPEVPICYALTKNTLECKNRKKKVFFSKT